MPIPNRTIPPLAREVYKRLTPNWALIEAVEKMNLKYPLQQDFIQRIKTQKDLSREQLIQSQQTPTGFEFPLGNTESLPFHISRTTSGSLPIFTDYRNGRNRVFTVLRKISGDKQELQQELAKLTSSDVIQKAGTLEVYGNHTRIIRLYLRGLGF